MTVRRVFLGKTLVRVDEMGELSVWHLLIVALVAFLLFGRGRISAFMGDFGKGIKNFRQGLKEDCGPLEFVESEPRLAQSEGFVPREKVEGKC